MKEIGEKKEVLNREKKKVLKNIKKKKTKKKSVRERTDELLLCMCPFPWRREETGWLGGASICQSASS